MAMACWIAVLAVAEAVQRVSRGTKTSLSYWGMVAAHLGLAVTITRHRLQPELQRGA
ncbi:Cytochrome c heme lyase subunit CcmF [Salmonella enterica subsp. enterica serovar Enteritidis]|nr:Cytochrome c heme lyase subunit CcmF [Salmonella enterica subsp. enterica serovar Enteritidis]